jgi:hypothetical protein
MSTRTLKVALAVLVCIALFIGWRGFALYLQIDAANRISSVYEETETIGLTASDPQTLALHIQWLQVYYQLNSPRLSGSPLHRVVRRAYEHTLTNSFSALRRLTTNDFGNDVSAWLHKSDRK